MQFKASGRIDVKEVVFAVEIFVLGIIGCIGSTTEAIMQLSNVSKFLPPCYIDVNAATIGTLTGGIQPE